MPPRYAYWTILIDNAPTAFRAKEQADLLPTLQQLRRTNKDVTLKWFAHGRLWDSPELAVRPRPPREDDGVKRGRDWRPGGQHKDPRARFDKPKKKFDNRTHAPARRDGSAQRPPFDRPKGTSFTPPSMPQRPWHDRPRPPHASGPPRDRRGPGGGADRRPVAGGVGSRPPTGPPRKPWHPKPQWSPRGPQERVRPSTDRRTTDRRPADQRTDQRPPEPRGDRGREAWKGAKPGERRGGWQGKPKPFSRRPPGRPDDVVDERRRRSKGPKGPGGSDSD